MDALLHRIKPMNGKNAATAKASAAQQSPPTPLCDIPSSEVGDSGVALGPVAVSVRGLLVRRPMMLLSRESKLLVSVTDCHTPRVEAL
jgi:hypothetical protein